VADKQMSLALPASGGESYKARYLIVKWCGVKR